MRAISPIAKGEQTNAKPNFGGKHYTVFRYRRTRTNWIHGLWPLPRFSRVVKRISHKNSTLRRIVSYTSVGYHSCRLVSLNLLRKFQLLQKTFARGCCDKCGYEEQGIRQGTKNQMTLASPARRKTYVQHPSNKE